ncbi:nicotinate (nicotinamide) nucleotide adenylyltransferase [Prevotella sp.]|uniref:nicotinate (nicotinamide) nucleotide adenylyltransferase n=1 Tax=Prevotella sp. TaxID=59823 RepID=UPI002F91C635
MTRQADNDTLDGPIPSHKEGQTEGHIGIFGGSFNPIHTGHIAMARHLLQATTLQEIWFMVSPQNPLKRNSYLLDDQKRLEMAQIALAHEDRIKVSDFEFHLPKPSYTLHTLQALSKTYPRKTFSLIIGGDNWEAFDRWFGYQDILSDYSILVYPRPNAHIDKSSLPPSVTVIDMPLLNISSTQIRQNIAEGKPITGLVPAEIEEMVIQNYREATPR